jgi:nanoRNase/pAp phosphatase (c-di-AMP/oligoRNAs hydrolase)
VDSGKLTREEILNPEGWVLLGFMMDPRTGLGRYHHFRIPNYELMEHLIDACEYQNIDEILANPDVAERVKLYFEQDALFKEMLRAHTRTDGNVIITDLRGVDPIYTGNRFTVYSLFPEQNVSLWIVDGRGKQNCPIACGYSILNRSCKSDVGTLMLKYGGGGHHMVGTCQVLYDEADKAIAEIVEKLKADDKE